MTTITYTEKDDMIKISLDGHAGYNPGNDPVCAGISTITFQLLNTLDVYESKGIISRFAADVKPGHTVISFLANDIDTWKIAWEIIHIGYKNIAVAYPNNVFME